MRNTGTSTVANDVDTQKRWGRTKAKMMGHDLRPAVRSPAVSTAGASIGVRHICVCRRCGAFLVIEEPRPIAHGSAIEGERCDVRYAAGHRPAGKGTS